LRRLLRRLLWHWHAILNALVQVALPAANVTSFGHALLRVGH
jgi:hypothetical protein